MKHLIYCLAIIALESFTSPETGMEKRLLDDVWKFTREDNPSSAMPGYDDSAWETVSVPHDWAIAGPFDMDIDAQVVKVSEDGDKVKKLRTGRTGALPFIGTGWYRYDLGELTADKGRRYRIEFDGAMSHAEVYVNGELVGKQPYGYSSFAFDITEYIGPGQENILAVRLENKGESSRWYPGAGIYRNVRLVVLQPVHIAHWGTYVTTPEVGENTASVNIRTTVENTGYGNGCKLVTTIIDPSGMEAAFSETPLPDGTDISTLEQTVSLDNIRKWDIEDPAMYTAVSRIVSGDRILDEYETPFGIRTFGFDPDNGFSLNGRRVPLQGVCLHHDLGPLGAAVNMAAVKRQMRILKEMGCNAIRTSHNMPAPEVVQAADEMGMMLMVESFDEWKTPKCQNGYNLLFDEWAEKDLVNLIRHFRNNPSVIMWCIGNEVPDQGTYQGAKLSRFLQDICHRADPTRLVTQGMDNPDAVVNNNMAAVMDVAGFNYRPFKYQINYDKIPQQIILGSETASTLSSRGVYKFPVERLSMKRYDDHQASSYDVEHCGWSNLPEDDWIWHDDKDFCIGEFVWTGFDYIGEPTPYYSDWPSHTSLFGIVDLAGIPKDRFYLYRSHWLPEEETLHILPHWNWEGREGEVTPIFVYTNYPSAELFINGKSQGRRTKDMSVNLEATANPESEKSFERQKRYRLMWMDTKYEPGTVKVVAYDKNGKAVAEAEMHTAGKPHHIELTADRTTIAADGRDLAFITVKVVDKDGNLCPNVQDLVKFKVKGEGTYRAGANGNPACLDLFHLPEMHLFNGMMTAIVQSTDESGEITLEASMKGVKKGKIVIATE